MALRRAGSMLFLAVWVGLIAMAALAGSAAADTTLGSTLADAQEGNTFSSGLNSTVYQENAPGETLTAPADGTITSWSVRSENINAQYELRVIRPGAGVFTAAGTSAPQTVTDPEDTARGPFATNLQVKAGDRIALRVILGPGAPIHVGTLPNDELNYFNGPFADGATEKPVLSQPLSPNQELLLQANFHPSAPTPPPTSTTTATAAPPPSPPTPHLAITAPRPGAPLQLDASGTSANGSRITGYRFQLSSDASQVIECGANAPVARANFAGPARGTATLTVQTASGASVATSAPYTSSGPTLLKRARVGTSTTLLTHQALVSVQCQPAPGSSPTQLVVGGQPINAACEVHAGLVVAVGCGLHPVGLCTGVPAPERALLAPRAFAGCTLRTKAYVFTARAGPSGRRASLVPRLKAELLPAVDAYYLSTEPVRINGLDVVPKSGAAVVIAVGGRYSTSFFSHSAAYVVSSSADVDLGPLPLRLGQQLNLDVNAQTHTSVHIADFNLKHPLPFLPEFSDLPLTGTLSANLVPHGATQLAAHVELPGVFTDQDGKGLTTNVTLKTNNTEGLVLDSFNVSIPNADLGFAEVQEVKLAYSRAQGTFDGSAGVTLPSGNTAKATIGFLHGNFNEFSFDYAFGPGEGIEVFDGIYLTELFGGLKLNPTEFDNGGRISLGPSVTDEGCGSVDIRGALNIHFGPLPFAIDSTGATEILCQNVGERYFHVDSDGHVIMGEAINFNIPKPDSGDNPSLARLSGNIDGQAYVNLRDRRFHFQFDGEIKATLGVFGISTEVEAEAVISDAGFGLCANIEGLFGSRWHPGIGENFSKVGQAVVRGPVPQALGALIRNVDVQGDSCNIAQYRSLPKGAAPASAARRGADTRAAAAGAYTFKVPANEKTAIVALHGSGGAPRVILHGPGGRTIDATGVAPVIDATEMVLHAPTEDFAEVQIRGANAGNWTIEAAPGSPSISQVAVSHELPAPRITGHVSGRGVRRVLRYSARVPAGTKITFLERGNGGSTVIGTTAGRSGRIAFTPSSAKTGTRTIIAALQGPDGTPKGSIVVTHYAASPPRPGSATQITVHRARGGLLIGFRPAPLAGAQFVDVSLGDGRRLLFKLKGSHHTVSVPAVPAGDAVLAVEVRGLGFGALGPPARAQKRLLASLNATGRRGRGG